MNPVSIIEVDIPFCDLVYGEAPCTAALGVTGDRKCFNVIRTCQDRENFDPSIRTLRFCEPTENVNFVKDGLPVVVIPSIQSISVTPAIVNPGVDIGQRESVKVTFKDHPHSDAGLDKYLADRAYDPFQQGTYWAKLRARNVSLEGLAFRLLRGEVGQPLEEMTAYRYVVDGISGQAESITIVAKDTLILTDQKKAQCPRISNGVLLGDISAVDGELDLSPSGIGDAEYPAAGKVAIGGKEVCQFTRVGDTLTLTVRGDSGTEADEHDEGDIVQLVKIYDSLPPADIIENLLVEFTPGIDPAWINTDEWDLEVDQYIGRLYSAELAEPTAVVTLLNELIEQVGLVFWWDPIAEQIRLRSLRPVSAGARRYTDDHFLPGFKATEQPQKRISEAWTYYGLRNPLEPIDQQSNYKAAIASFDAQASEDYPQPAIRKVFSRWIADNNRPAASRLNAQLLSRYRDAPRRFSFSLYASIEEVPSLGSGLQLMSWSLQDDTGANAAVPAQVTSIETRDDRFVIDSQEAIFASQDDLETVKLIFIDDDAFNVNLRNLHDQIYSEPQEYDQIRVIISGGVWVGSQNSMPAFDVGDWPDFVDIELVTSEGGGIQGKGGRGASVPSIPGEKGGTGLFTRYPLRVTNNGTINGGGGGGGRGQGFNIGTDPEVIIKGAGGGGGAGRIPGTGGSLGGASGTATTGGQGGTYHKPGGGGTSFGGQGGGPGLPGLDGNNAASQPGAAGDAVDGESFITYDLEGTILGGRVN